MERISKLGVDYDKAHKEDMDRLAASNELLANYDPADFKYAVKGDGSAYIPPFETEVTHTHRKPLSNMFQ